MESEPKRYFFFDRDGTIIEHVHHLCSAKDVKWVDQLVETFLSIAKLGFFFALVTNQSVISRGLINQEQSDDLNRFILRPLESSGVNITHVLVCPHLPEDECKCRKPKIGLLDEVKQKEIIDFKNSFMIGDQESDVEFGKILGMRTVRICRNEEITFAEYRVNKLSESLNIVQKLYN